MTYENEMKDINQSMKIYFLPLLKFRTNKKIIFFCLKLILK